ncbi:MAG: PD-(D/E)XK nuclease family protein [Collinsella sp.]
MPEPMDSFTLVEPANVYMRVVPAERAPRDSYSYSSVSAELHEEAEDHPEPAEALCAEAAGETAVSDGVEAPRDERVVPSHEGDPTALGSAFHAACQWLIELDRADLPVERADALCRYWGCTAAQRERFDEAVARWLSSDVRAEALAWPCRRAEVPFYSLGMDGLVERFGPYAEGAIDLLCTDPARPGRALLIDYKTGGSSLETPEQLQEKHALQASVYADVLHKAGYEQVTLRFVRVEVPDPSDPTQPQVVTYEL